MDVYKPDHQLMSSLQPGDFYEVREAGVVGFVVSFDSQQGRDLAGVDLLGPTPFSIRQLGTATCLRIATRDTAKLVTTPKDQAARLSTGLGTLLEDANCHYYLTVALPDSASFSLATVVPELAFVSLAEWMLRFEPLGPSRPIDRWEFTRNGAVLFDRTAA